MSKRNYALDFLKLFFTLIIIIHHTYYYDVLVRGYICVEFFFFVSGYFICKSFEKNISVSAFVKDRFLRVYPGYILTLIILIPFVYSVLVNICTYDYLHCYQAERGFILELIMLQDVGIFYAGGGLNHVAWFISTLFYGSILIYFLYHKCKKFVFHFIGMIIVVLTYSYLILYIGGVECWDLYRSVGDAHLPIPIYIAFFRGVSDLFIGIWMYKLPKLSLKISNILQMISFIAVCVLFFIPGMFDFITVVFLFILAYASFTPGTIFDKFGQSDIFSICYDRQYYMYITQLLAIYVSLCIDYFYYSFSNNAHTDPLSIAFDKFLFVFTLIFAVAISFVVKYLSDRLTTSLKNMNLFK